jgi:hypothetical protein
MKFICLDYTEANNVKYIYKLKVVGNEKNEGSGRRQMFDNGLLTVAIEVYLQFKHAVFE